MRHVHSQIKRLFAKRTVLNLLIGFLLYCALTGVMHYFSFMHPHAVDFGVEHFRDLTVALWANVIFAGTFGLLAAIISVIRPEEDSLDKRLGYLYPRSVTLSAQARSHLGKNAMKLAAPAVSGDLLFIVEKFDADTKAFWLDVYVTFTLRNILQDESYEDEIEILIAPDEVAGVAELGRLHESSVLCTQANPVRTVHTASRPITAAAKCFQEFVPIVIPPKAEAIHSYHFSGWSLEGVPWTFKAQRYSENVKIRMANRTARQISSTLSRGTSNPTVKRVEMVNRQLSELGEVTLGDGVVLDGSRDNIQIVIACVVKDRMTGVTPPTAALDTRPESASVNA